MDNVKLTTLCYIEKDQKYLMLYRNKKENDQSKGKWIGVGGKLEPGESPEECLLREVKEETGLTLTDYRFCGIVTFLSDVYEGEYMFLYTADGFTGELAESCGEGELQWIPKSQVLQLPAWEGDHYFLEQLLAGKTDIHIKLRYEGEKIAEVIR